MTYQIHTVQHIEVPEDAPDAEDEAEMVLRSFRIRTLSESPRQSLEVRPLLTRPATPTPATPPGNNKPSAAQKQGHAKFTTAYEPLDVQRSCSGPTPMVALFSSFWPFAAISSFDANWNIAF